MKGLTVFWELNKISESMIRPKLKRQENTIDKKKGERINNVKYYVTLLGCKKSVNNSIKGLPLGSVQCSLDI